MTKPTVTLRDLANQLNLSPATVSRALNGYPEVNQRTRARVERVAAELGYHPNLSAKRLVRGQTGAIGVVLQREEKGFIDPLLAEFLDGVSTQVAQSNTDIILFSSTKKNALDTYRRVIAQQTVDGFIVSAPLIADRRIVELTSRSFPFVLHGRTDIDTPHSYYDIDNFGGFEQATRILADYDHRNIAFIGGSRDARFTADRLSGARSGLARNGLTLPDENIHFGVLTEKLGYEAGQRFFEQMPADRPTAFLCLSLYVAQGLMRAGRERWLVCPRDYSLVVHDDRAPYLRAEFFDPPLTAVQSSIRHAGQEVAAMLLEKIRKPDTEPLQTVAPVELVMRESVGRNPLAA